MIWLAALRSTAFYLLPALKRRSQTVSQPRRMSRSVPFTIDPSTHVPSRPNSSLSYASTESSGLPNSFTIWKATYLDQKDPPLALWLPRPEDVLTPSKISTSSTGHGIRRVVEIEVMVDDIQSPGKKEDMLSVKQGVTFKNIGASADQQRQRTREEREAERERQREFLRVGKPLPLSPRSDMYV